MNNLQKFAQLQSVKPIYKLRFFLRKSKSDPKRGTIYIRMLYEGTTIDLGSTGETAYFNNFNYQIPNDREDIKKQINKETLVQIIFGIKEVIEDNHPTTAHNIRNIINGKVKTNYTLLDLMNKCLNESPDIIAEETKKSWRSKIAKLQSYLLEKKYETVTAERFDCIQLNQYIEFLKIKGLSHSTIPKHRDTITKTMKWATSIGILKQNPLRDFKLYGISNTKKSKKALTWESISNLRNYPFDGLEKRAVDMFIFSCCTGICYTDMKNLKEHLHLEHDKLDRLLISNNRQKTVLAEFCTPLWGFALEIYREYGRLENIVTIDNSTVNKIIKYCFERIGFSHKLANKITFHSARHTFITYCKKEKKMIDESIMVLSGHENKKSVQGYIYIDDNSALEAFYSN